MELFRCAPEALAHLKKRDKKLGKAIERIGILEREITPDLFSSLAGCIVSQQISGKAAETIYKRLEELAGEITPKSIDALEAEQIQKCGMSLRKAGYLKSTARSVVSGEVELDGLQTLGDQEIVERLVSLKGIGVWTAEMLMIFSLRRPDVLSWGDLGIKRGMTRLYGLKELSREQFERCRKRYSPYGSTASLYLWEIASEPGE